MGVSCTTEQPVLTTKCVSVYVCWDWVGAGRRPLIVTAVLAVTRGESPYTHTHTHHSITDPLIGSEPLFGLFSCFSTPDVETWLRQSTHPYVIKREALLH